MTQRPTPSESSSSGQVRDKVRYFILIYIPVLIFFSLTCYGLFHRDYLEIVDEIGDQEYNIIQENGRNLQ